MGYCQAIVCTAFCRQAISPLSFVGDEVHEMLNAYSVDSVIIHKWNGNDQWGEPLADSLIPVKGYVVWKTRLVRDIRGEEVVSTVSVLLDKKIEKAICLNRALAHEDRIAVDGIVRPIVSIAKPKAFSGPHYEVFLS